MSKNLLLPYDLLISCPGDVKDEIGIIEEVVLHFNDLYSDTLGIIIRPKYWRKNSFPQTGDNAQSVLNKQLVDICDGVVAILWTRFGTPTDEYGSGTEEEIERMRASGKDVFMYFSDKPISPSQMDESYEKVKEYRKGYKGLYYEYPSNKDFKSFFSEHLYRFFSEKKIVAEVKEECRPPLKIVGIDQNKQICSDEAPIIQFVPNAEMTISMYLEKIRNLYSIISDTVLEKRTLSNSVYSFTRPVEIGGGDRGRLQAWAEQLEIHITEDFFALGNLSKEALSDDILEGTPCLRGTEAEKEKYDNIQKLLRITSKTLQWAPVESEFANKMCLQLALQNNGSAIDEDVEITFRIPKNSLLLRSEFPKFDDTVMKYLLDDDKMRKIFGICSAPKYRDYDKSLKTSQRFFPRTCDCRGDFERELDGIFYYEVWVEGEECILKINFDYIKHHKTTIAFPSVIFIKEPFEIMPYTITSKNLPKIVSGEIKITDCVSELPTL